MNIMAVFKMCALTFVWNQHVAKFFLENHWGVGGNIVYFGICHYMMVSA